MPPTCPNKSILNPATNRCVAIDGKIGLSLIKKKVKRINYKERIRLEFVLTLLPNNFKKMIMRSLSKYTKTKPLSIELEWDGGYMGVEGPTSLWLDKTAVFIEAPRIEAISARSGELSLSSLEDWLHAVATKLAQKMKLNDDIVELQHEDAKIWIVYRVEMCDDPPKEIVIDAEAERVFSSNESDFYHFERGLQYALDKL